MDNYPKPFPKLPLKEHKNTGWFIKESLTELARIKSKILASYGEFSFTFFLLDEVSRSMDSLRQELDSLVRAEYSRTGEEDIETVYYGEVKNRR